LPDILNKENKKQKRIQLGLTILKNKTNTFLKKKWDIDIGLTLVFTMVPE